MKSTPNPGAAQVLRPILPSLAAEIIAALREEIPEYDRPLSGPFGATIRQGVEQALARFADALEDPARSRRLGRETYVALGRGERAAGRSLEALLSAYRTGARVAWHRVVESGVQAGLEPSDIYALGGAIFAYIDELSAESAEGYAEQQSREVGERMRRIRAVLRALLAEPPVAGVLAAAADELGWTPPDRIAVVVGPAHASPRLSRRVDAGDLVAELDDETVAVDSDPDDAKLHSRLARAASEDTVLGLGPVVPPTQAALSARRARAARQLGEEGTGGLVIADEHLDALLIRRDRDLAAALADGALAPLGALTPATEAKLRDTLRAWLDHQGRIEPAAAALGVHPQTVRYRLGRLREALGDRLDDPDGRFALTLALRCAEVPAASGQPE